MTSNIVVRDGSSLAYASLIPKTTMRSYWGVEHRMSVRIKFYL